LRDISNLETPPPDRLPIETRICSFDPVLIRHAITRELSREGQIFFVHPRVYDINEIADQLRQIVPGLRVVVAHGQMPPDELERNMLQFVRHQADLLVATTIIESGVDIPNANTIFINEADLYGLADLHQLRGRVGRYKNRAYAYLLLNPNKLVTPTASKRLKAIEEFADLGAGFRIAMRDLEIRGAGNLLGTEQSGHIAAVGYELYCELLENAVRRLQNQPLRQPLDVGIALPWPAYLPRDYVPAQKQRLEVYRRLARVRDLETLQDFRTELRDRFGPIPPAADWLLHAAEIRIRAAAWNIRGIHCDGDFLVLSYQDAQAIHALAKRAGGRLRVVDDRSAYYRLADRPALARSNARCLAGAAVTVLRGGARAGQSACQTLAIERWVGQRDRLVVRSTGRLAGQRSVGSGSPQRFSKRCSTPSWSQTRPTIKSIMSCSERGRV
jgi:transcription-repair coupling factor (superfamily II helicase)